MGIHTQIILKRKDSEQSKQTRKALKNLLLLRPKTLLK